MKRINNLFAAVLCFFLTSILTGQNLLNNGDFESGLAGTGFTVPDYTLYVNGDTQPGQYVVTNNPSGVNQFFTPNLMDHTPGPGNTVMVVDGSTNRSASFWSAGDNNMGLCGLIPNRAYTFSYWVRTISISTVDVATQPNITPRFTNTVNANGNLIFGNPRIGLPAQDWQQVNYTFTATAACVNINLVNENGSPGGNDFMIDDLEVILQLCDPTFLSINNPDPVCEPNVIDLTDPDVTMGSIGGGMTTYWMDMATTIPLVNPNAVSVSGTYYIKSESGLTCFDVKPVSAIIRPVIVPIFTQVDPICEGDALDPLPIVSNNGIVGSWSPPLDNTNVGTSTYTFTPDTSPNPNLVFNGDFSLGDTGFTTDYTVIPTSNGTVQGVYGIVTNSNMWFNALSTCMDTQGTGNFMVVDASTQNGGNDRVWCQTIPVMPGEDFIFSYQSQSVSGGSPARLEVEINGVVVGMTNLPNQTCLWSLNSTLWNSGAANTAEICIYDRNTDQNGNDFGLDDIRLTPQSIQCASVVNMMITVDPAITPTFDAIDPICVGQTLNPLPTTSLEGITGIWSPAVDNMATTTYTFMPDADQCTATPLTEIVIMVMPGNVMPTFTQVDPVCQGDTLSPLPTTSLEGITGIWSPALDNMATTTYTFTPDTGQCTSSTFTTMTIVVDPGTTPTFAPVNPVCQGSTIAPLPTTSNEGVTGTWSPALDNTQTTTYTFMPDAGQCTPSMPTTLTIVVNSTITPTFTAVAPICAGDALAPLPTTSIEGVTGIWSPALDNMATTTYSFTPDAGQCPPTTETTLTIMVNPIITPTFAPVAPICEGDALSPLPTTSNEGVTGTWAPALDSQTTTTYTFTPNAGQCTPNTLTTLTITVDPGTTPTFAPVNPVCQGSTIAPLPTTSNEGVTGTWSPALDNTQTTTYTFMPDAGQCTPSMPTTLTIVVNSTITPTFTAVAPICAGDALAPLPTTSIEGVTGVWSPALDNMATTTYSFTPDAGQCPPTTETTLTIMVNPIITPTFAPVAPICEGDALSPLPTTSNEGVTGSWSPVLDNTTTTTYMFTPDAGQCTPAMRTMLTITVNPDIIPTFAPVAPICEGDALAPLPTTSNEGVTGSWSPALDNTQTTTYTFMPDAGQCTPDVLTILNITVNPAITPTFTAVTPICEGDTLAPLPTTSIEGITGAWSPALDNTITTTYTFTADGGQCTVATSTTLTITVNPIITPTFAAVAPICEGDMLLPLPTTSMEGITGTWSPALDNTTTTTYTFRPDAGQCADSQLTELTITVDSKTVPNFTYDNSAICSGGSLLPLPTTSNQGISGSWSPALDNTLTTTYTFIPDSGQCSANAFIEIEVTQPDEPNFEEELSLCFGEAAPVLDTISPNGISGTWSPAMVSNTASAEYIFTPNMGECAISQTIEVTVNQVLIIDFVADVGADFSGDRTVTVTVAIAGEFLYQLDNDAPQEDNVFENVTPGRHDITVLDLNSCSTPVSKVIQIIDYPKFFTPNGDGVNDTWNILGLEESANVSVLIFDRYGKFLSQIESISSGWDGSYNGAIMPTSDYWFVVEYELEPNVREQFKANFTLKR